MSFYEYINYVVYDNPVSKSVINSVKATMPSPEPPKINIIKECTSLWKLAAEKGPFVRVAGAFGASGVVLAAYGAHKLNLKEKPEEVRHVFDVGNRMHLLHSLAVLGAPLCKNPKLSGSLLIAGTILFSGPCYYYAFTGKNSFGKLAPVGGTLLIAGWLAMML